MGWILASLVSWVGFAVTPVQPNAAIAAIVSTPTTTSPAIIQAVEFDRASDRLLIRSTERLVFDSQWRRGAYQILIAPARLAEGLTLPQVPATVMQVNVWQEAGQTVVVELRLAAGMRIQQVSQVTPQRLSVQLQPVQR